MRQKRLFLHNAFPLREFIEIWDDGDREFVPFSGDARCFLAAEPEGDAIHADLDASTTFAETTEEGVFAAPDIASDKIDEHLSTYIGKAVYKVVIAGPDDELRIVTTLLVTDVRYAA